MHPAHPAGGGDNIVFSGYNVHIVLAWMDRGGRKTSPKYKSHFEPSLPHFFTLMNNAGAVHMATPDRDSIAAPIIWTKTFSVLKPLQKAEQ